MLDRPRETSGLPKAIIVDNGRSLPVEHSRPGAYQHPVEIRFIRPGKPIEDAYVESSNGKFRHECLNKHWFLSVAEARTIIEAWRQDYNIVRPRPHGSLEQLTSAAYAAACAPNLAGEAACSAAFARSEQGENPDGLSQRA